MNCCRRRGESAQVLFFALIVVIIIAAGGWYLFSSRGTNEKAARDFALYAGERILLHQDTRFVNHHLSPEAQVKYPPSWRERMFTKIKDFGAPSGPVTVRGDVSFTNRFFDPRGTFRTEVLLGGQPAYVDLWTSQRGPVWQIDNINFSWVPKPSDPALAEPVPAEAAGEMPAAAPSPTPTLKKPRK